MNQAEKRRRILLEQTRKKYSDEFIPPAVHPRYRNTYYELYGDCGRNTKSSLGIRVLVCMLLFVLFVYAEQNQMTICNKNSSQILEMLNDEMDVKLVLKTLID